MTASPDPLAHPGRDETAADSPTAGGRGRSAAILVLVLALGAGFAWAGSQGGALVGGVPVFALAVAWVFLVQFVGFLHAWTKQTEHYFDLLGSLTYITTVLAAWVLSGHRDATALLIGGAVVVWAARLGTFLFRRVRRAGSDDRFDAIKPNFPRFLNVWMLQGLWVTITLGAALAAITAAPRPAFGAMTVVGLLVWAFGFGFEVVADTQKSRFRAEPANKGEFISTGVWAWSRHPNYFGEIVAWAGIALAAFPALHGWQYITLLSPVFVVLLLTRVSGIPPLEKKADARWGDRPDYRDYRATTPVLVPRPRPRRA